MFNCPYLGHRTSNNAYCLRKKLNMSRRDISQVNRLTIEKIVSIVGINQHSHAYECFSLHAFMPQKQLYCTMCIINEQKEN